MNTFKPEDDKKFYLEIPDANFSPERNKAVVRKSIKKYNAMQAKKGQQYKDAYGERSEAVISYLRMAEKKPGYDLLRYFDKSYLTFLRGDDIRRELMARMKLYNNKGELVIFN